MSFPISLPDPFANDASLNWEVVEDAIRAWVKAGSGFGDARVWWADQKVPQGATDFITVKLGDALALGAVDESESLTDLTRAAGQEIENRTRGVREFGVTLQAFCSATTGNRSGRAILGKVQAALALPAVREALNDAGISPFDVGTVQNISALAGTVFEGRALLEVRFYATETVSEYLGYIEEVETTSYMGSPLSVSGTKDAIDI